MTSLSQSAALVYAAVRRTPPDQRYRAREVRHALPQPLSRKTYAQAWRELVSHGLVPGAAEGVTTCPAAAAQ